MPQAEAIRSGGHVIGVYSFTSGFAVLKEPEAAVTVSEARVLAMCEHLEAQGDPEEAWLLLDRYLTLTGQRCGNGEKNPQV